MDIKIDNLEKIKALLLSGAKITTLSVLRTVGTIEVRHYLSILRKEGMIIKDRWVSLNGKHFKMWWIDDTA